LRGQQDENFVGYRGSESDLVSTKERTLRYIFRLKILRC